MPRPGPRPYECIRRAWHSENHQALRGALIHEIFRVVNELHSTTTRRKKEWQEKLPIVVLRAEEILYSKANSESEYADVETLRARLEDAVNTMIRREDTEEEGAYLAPCVEAALSLGCTPKKVSRGQRQVASRFSANSTRRNHSVNATSGGYKTLAGNGSNQMRSGHEKGGTTLSSYLMDTKIQDQCLKAATPTKTSLYGSVGVPVTPNLCPNNVYPATFAMPTPFDVACPFTTNFPQLGSLVQFLKEDGDSMGMLRESHYTNHHDLRSQKYDETSLSRVETQFGCHDFTIRADGALTNSDIAPQMSLPSTDSKTIIQEHRTAIASDTYPVDTHMNPHMLCFSTAPIPWYSSPIPASMLSHISTDSDMTSIPSLEGDASCFTDLQLRLGPPGKEASGTSIGGDTLASKRLKVSNGQLDFSVLNAEQFQL